MSSNNGISGFYPTQLEINSGTESHISRLYDRNHDNRQNKIEGGYAFNENYIICSNVL